MFLFSRLDTGGSGHTERTEGKIDCINLLIDWKHNIRYRFWAMLGHEVVSLVRIRTGLDSDSIVSVDSDPRKPKFETLHGGLRRNVLPLF